MNKLTSFFNNNNILFLSWLCALFYFVVAWTFSEIDLVLSSYLIYIMICCYYLLIAILVFSIFYSFYQSIKNININKKYAFVLLIFYLVVWLFCIYSFFHSIDNNSAVITVLFVFMLINICIFVCLYHKFKKQSIAIINYLLFYGINFFLVLFFLLMGTVHDL